MKVKLKDLGKISTGNTPSKNISEFYNSEDIGFVKPDMISEQQINFIENTTEYLAEAARNKARIVKKNAVFVTCIGSIGKVGIAKNKELAFNQQINAIEPNEKVLPKYLAYGIFANKRRLQTISNAPVVPIINKTQFGEFEIDINNDTKEQLKVVELLDKVSGVITKRRKELEKLDELIKARFIEMFGDPMTNPYNLPKVILGSVLTIEPQNGLYKPQSDYVSDGTGVPILRIDSFYDGKVSDLSSLKRLICSEAELKRYLLYENDIVINRVNSIEYLGKCGLIQGLVENTVFESNMMRLHIDENKFHPVYITKLLCSEFTYQQILRRAKKAVNQASINQKDVQSFVVYMPPIEQQNQFATFVEQIDEPKAVVQKALDQAQILFDSLMQEYFG